MDFNEFKETFKEDLKNKLGELGINAALSEHHIDKLNQSYEAISATPEGSHIGVNVNLDSIFHSYINGSDYSTVPYYASRVNGITDDMVKDARTFAEVLPDFLGFIGDSILVGHNIQSFDMKFLYRECQELYGETLANDYVDTLYYSRRKVPKLRHHRLTDMAEYFNISTVGAHRALNDCRMNQEVFERLSRIGR